MYKNLLLSCEPFRSSRQKLCILKFESIFEVCGIHASSPQWCGCILILWNNHLNLALLLHKTVLVTFHLASTVFLVNIYFVCQSNTFFVGLTVTFLCKPSRHVWFIDSCVVVYRRHFLYLLSEMKFFQSIHYCQQGCR